MFVQQLLRRTIQVARKLAMYLGVGVVGMLTDVSSLVLFIPALHDITRATDAAAAQVAAFALLYLLTLLPLLLRGSGGGPLLSSPSACG